MPLGEGKNITYRRRRYRSLEGRTGEMRDSSGKNTTTNPTYEKEDYVIRGLLKVLQDLADGQKETREVMGKIASYSLGSKHGEDRGERSNKGTLDEGRNSTKSNIEVITSRTNSQNGLMITMTFLDQPCQSS